MSIHSTKMGIVLFITALRGRAYRVSKKIVSSRTYIINRGVLNIVVALLDGGANIKIANSQGVTALHKAALFGHVTIVRKLIESGAEPNSKDSSGDTALHVAAKGGFLPVVKFLLDADASASVKNAAGQMPKDVAANKAVADLLY